MAPRAIYQVSLQKGDRTAVLLGLAHIAPKSFFSKVQAEIDRAKQAGYTLFFEKTRVVNPLAPTHEESLLARFVTEARHARVMQTGWELDNVLNLPGHFNADATMSELAERFAQAGIDFSLPWDEFAASLNRLLDLPAGYDILVTYRDEVIVSRIAQWCPKGNFLAVYGLGHLNGMQRLLMQDGWGRAHWSILDFLPEH